MDDETRPSQDLSPVDKPEIAGDPVAIAAMAEAFRAQAEILQNINRTQREIAESLEKSERASGVLTSTRALNDTFKGLTDIQKGLLDALTDSRSRGSLWPIALAALGLVACLALLFFLNQAGEPGVPRAEYARVEQSYRRAAQDLARLRLTETERAEELARHKERAERALEERADYEQRAEAAESEAETLRIRNRGLAKKAEIRSDELQSYLAVKAQADRAGLLEVENADLRRRLRDAEQRVKRLDEERLKMADLLLDRTLEARSPAGEILEAARKKGLLEDPEPPPDPDSLRLQGTVASTFVKRLNRLLQKAGGETSYEVIVVKKVENGVRLVDVSVGCYKGARLLNSLQSKALEIWADVDKDQLELRFEEGFYASVANPGNRVPFTGGRHSVFLTDVGLAAWLDRFRRHVEVGPDGRLTWKTTPS